MHECYLKCIFKIVVECLKETYIGEVACQSNTSFNTARSRGTILTSGTLRNYLSFNTMRSSITLLLELCTMFDMPSILILGNQEDSPQ
jgi:hypothetical protein